MIHSGRTQAQIARELGVSEYSLTLWKRAYLEHLKPAQVGGEQMSAEQMALLRATSLPTLAAKPVLVSCNYASLEPLRAESRKFKPLRSVLVS